MSPADPRPANPAAETLQRLQAQLQRLRAQLQPWYDAVEDPAQAQEAVLHNLLKDYARTDYGAQHGAGQIGSVDDYRRAFPVVTYEEVKPLIQRVMGGEESLLLCEEPVGWAITRGTTAGESKFIPMTATDLRMRVSAGRAMMNYVLDSKRFDLFQGVNLNLNFPSVVGTVRVDASSYVDAPSRDGASTRGEREVEYGYSSGIYTKYVSRMTPIRSVPSQEEIDALGGGKTVQDWENRFELAYEQCKDQNVTLVGGVCPTALRFARYLRRTHAGLSQGPVADADHDPGQHAGDQYAARAGAARTVWRFRGHPRDLWRDRGACLASSGTPSGPGRPTMTYSFSRCRASPRGRGQAARCCTRCARARWGRWSSRRRSCHATGSAT